VPVEGDPDPKHISTSYAERANLTMRMHMRRYTRLTNGFSKKVENHAHSMALFTTYYNFVRIHKTLRVTPAMAAGVSSRLWEASDIVALLEATEPKPGKRGTYKIKNFRLTHYRKHEPLAEDHRSCQIPGWHRGHRSAANHAPVSRFGSERLRFRSHRSAIAPAPFESEARLWGGAALEEDHVKVSRSHPCRR
jgi:hypothetical protein